MTTQGRAATPAAASSGKDTSVAVVRKAAAILDALMDGELTPAQLAATVQEPRSSMYRLLSTLEDLGLVEPGVRRGTYRLGIKLLRMGNAVRAGRDERRAALPVMERIHELTSETVFLVVRRGDVGVCIERIDGLRVQSLALQLGGWLPLHAGAAMRVLLAYEPETEWSAYVRRNSPLERLSPQTPVTEEDLFAELTRVRKTGISVSDEDVTVGIAAVGAPIFGESGQLVGALSASGVREYILGEGSRVTDLVADGARTISASLGWQQP